MCLQPESDLVPMPASGTENLWTCPLGLHPISEAPAEEPLLFLPAVPARNESPATAPDNEGQAAEAGPAKQGMDWGWLEAVGTGGGLQSKPFPCTQSDTE
jgi:hypothetical protein